jgi:hypothetical protein
VIEKVGGIGLILRLALEKDLETVTMSDLVGLWGIGLELEWRVDAVIVGFGKGLV